MLTHRCLMLPLMVVTLLLLPKDSFAGILFPRESESREVRNLDGIWNFRVSPKDNQNAGFEQQWYLQSLSKTGEVLPMPVPSSYNDITQEASIRDYIGWVWYDKTFYVPRRWQDNNQRVFIRFGSVNYNAEVYLNGIATVQHSGGHLPFLADITSSLKYNAANRITVAVNNTLTPNTIPQGKITIRNDTLRYPQGYVEQTYNFDFFNYAGIHRPVYIYTTPSTYVDDVTVVTSISDTTGIIKYSVEYLGPEKPTCYVDVVDKEDNVVAQAKGFEGEINVPNANLWWPYLMDPNPGYLYTLEIRLTSTSEEDVYRQPVGIRTVTWTNTSFLINDRPFYFRGFGRHEDSYIRGRGLDYPLVIKDHNLIKWVGANSYRTSHYPYAEEILERADNDGIVIIDECPGVGLDIFDEELLAKHKSIMEELVQRDKNRPSVVMWSIGNEPQSQKEQAGPYFSAVVNVTKAKDGTRPVTLVVNKGYNQDKGSQFVDVICVNRYYGWYSDTGHLEVIQLQTETEFTEWHKKFNKPVLISEYGAGTLAGIHSDPEFVWSEDYQVAYLEQHFKAFDNLRKAGFFVGEMIWNFADFATPQETFRPPGCMKGIFTRERSPKAAAHTTRCRYWSLARDDDGVSLPSNLRDRSCLVSL